MEAISSLRISSIHGLTHGGAQEAGCDKMPAGDCSPRQNGELGAH